ncbi:methionyl-tRNA formyltransferase [Sphingobium aromaticiconvertens]|uniref:methionyl-tRNA formyltransferase n=1 Tax=Sphingobium aromaticiconvertens TaxID=365341 RepID=UPI003016E179
MRAAIIGAVESTQVGLEAVGRAQGWEAALVLTLHAELAARHSDFVDLAPVAAQVGARLYKVRNVNDPDALEQLRAAAPDVILVIGWSQICGEGVSACAPGRIIGYHPAALPRLRGRAVIPWTILNREPITAGSLFWIDEGVDTGAILDQYFFHVGSMETAEGLYAKHMQALALMLDRTLPAIAAGRERHDPQDEALATWAARRTAEDGRIDWTARAQDIALLVRAVGRPYPGAFTMAGKDGAGQDRLVIWSAKAIDGTGHHAKAGQVVTRHGDGFAVMCGDGNLLDITEWSSATGRLPAAHQRLGAL